MYLNTVYFGRGAYGIQAAAQAYFGVDAEDLTLNQSASLAAIIKAPSIYAVSYTHLDVYKRQVIKDLFISNNHTRDGFSSHSIGVIIRIHAPYNLILLGDKRGLDMLLLGLAWII